MQQTTFLKINAADSVVVCLQPKKKATSSVSMVNKSLSCRILPLDTKFSSKTRNRAKTSSSMVIPSDMPRRT